MRDDVCITACSFAFSVDLSASNDTTVLAILTWTDPPATSGAAVAAAGTGGPTVVFNDLDLSITDGIDFAAVNGRICPRDQSDQVPFFHQKGHFVTRLHFHSSAS